LGFVVKKSGSVLVDHSINDFGDTRVEHNPTLATTLCETNPLPVHSVILRRGYKGDRVAGDNCPLIYGLKNKENLFVGYNAMKTLLPSVDGILDKFVLERIASDIKYDLVIPMPSSHNISSILARRVQRHLTHSALHTTAFRKSNSDDIERQLDQGLFSRGARLNIMNAVNKANTNGKEFSLSDVKMDFRGLIVPLTQEQLLPEVNNILIVDDLFASGQTLVTAKNKILEQLPNANVEALCLFSPLNGRIRKSKSKRR